MSLSLPSLRTWRSTIHASSSRANANTVEGAVESPASINNRLSQQQRHETSVTELRRRLVRKASTFSLRSKNKKSQQYLRDLAKHAEESDSASVETITQEAGAKGREVQLSVVETAVKFPVASKASPEPAKLPQPKPSPLKIPQPGGKHKSVSMASESSPPPVSFKRLQEITTEACDSTLEPATTYVHANTAEWNTTIINSILQKLVKETTSDLQPQPPYKYIVNSTIIQHSSGGDGGRRGMHAASGAYWNNEKDGMWNFKYEAAEGKGLDVVIGIIWVWIG